MKHFAVVPLAILAVYNLVVFTEGAENKCVNERPIIGVLAQTLTSKKIKQQFPFTAGRSFIPASYVKWIEASGARVLPIKENLTPTKLTELLDSINGVVFPGGISSLSSSKYARNGRIVFDYAIQANKSGKVFPVFGICLGFQLLTTLVTGRNLLRRTYSSRVSLKVDFTNAVDSSAMFADLSRKLKMLATKRPLAFNNHRWGIYKGTFKKGLLKKFYKLLATSKDKKGVEFVAAIEAKDYPIYGLQWHPEKPSFEWNPALNMDKSFDSIIFGQAMGNFFINEARKNCNKFKSKRAETRALMHSYYPLYTGDVSTTDQMYIF
eukprot:Seg2778.1 transcript_id=Seg2778.1/GoldUCD/mRNA.D3Y31 product="Gamma-glutamyl hydrolase" protein_id=Seg2778.1/GoldUCD/D3Y31